MANVKYNLVIQIDPITIPAGNQQKAIAAHKFAKWISRQAGRVVCWFMNGEAQADGEYSTTNPGVKVSAQVLNAEGKVASTKVIDGYSVAQKDVNVKFKKKEGAAASESFDLDAFLSNQ